MFVGLTSIGLGKQAIILIHASLALTTVDNRAGRTPSALEFIVGAVQELCLADHDRIETARRLVPANWRVTDTEDHIDVVMGDEAIFPRHDAHERGWRGALSDGRGTLSVETTEYRDLARPHDFSAAFSVSPESVVDLAAFQRRIGMSLHARGAAIEGEEPARLREIVTGWVPSERQFGRMQAYTLEPAPAGTEITAIRYWGAGYPEQSLRIMCQAKERRAE